MYEMNRRTKAASQTLCRVDRLNRHSRKIDWHQDVLDACPFHLDGKSESVREDSSVLFLWWCFPESVDELITRALHTAHHYFAHSLEQLVAERRIFLAIFAKNCAVEKDRRCRLAGPGCEMPPVRRKNPGPAQQVARADHVDQNGRAADLLCRFESYLAVLD